LAVYKPSWERYERDDVLLQQYYQDDPWRILVTCILLNQTGRTQVDRVLDAGFFEKYKKSLSLAWAEIEELTAMIRPLGFQNVRAKRLKAMSLEWARLMNDRRGQRGWPPKEAVAKLTGIGDYALDSYCFFVLKDFTHFRSGDKELGEWLRNEVKQGRFRSWKFDGPTPILSEIEKQSWFKLIELGW